MSAALTCNDAAVLRGYVLMPRSGRWVAELTLDAGSAPSGKVTLASHDGAFRIVGTVERGDVSFGTVFVRVVGGAGGLDKEVEPRAYRAMPLRALVTDILSAVGERLAPSADASVLSTVLPVWTRERTMASRALTALADGVGATWRVLADGAVWIGKEKWPKAATFTYDVLDAEAHRDRLLLGVEAPALMPATTFRDRRVSLVAHTVGERGVRTEVWFERETESARLLAAFRTLVQKTLSRVDYLALYPAKVIAQNGDGSLELKPDSDRLPGLSRVPLRTGMPGVKVKVAAGARVLVGFEHGDPARPFASTWEEPGLTELQVGGARPVARQGDQVALTMPPVVQMMGMVNGSQPFVGTIAIMTPLIGTILTGSGKLKA